MSSIKNLFLQYFQNKGHALVESSSLVPDDKSLLFTNAGMVQFKPIFLGQIPIPKPPLATSSQVCLRVGGKHNDLNNVGYTARHHTLFEMLGNFSFGDYFKEQAIDYAYEFLTSVLELSKDKLYISVHDSDNEAFKIWQKYFKTSHIVRMGDKDNFWQMGDEGPCGPCSEIYYDQGENHFKGTEDYLGGDGDRFLEIWNLVFMQFNRSKDGKLEPLAKPCIDTGMGLERMAALQEGVFNNFDSSLFMPSIQYLKDKIIVDDKKHLSSLRVISDHIRSICFLLIYGVNFDNVGRGYVLRRILRRAVRHGYKIGFKEPFLFQLATFFINQHTNEYEDLAANKIYIIDQIHAEEQRFFNTLAQGMALFEQAVEATSSIFSGQVAFKLYDTFGFPYDLTADMLKELNISLDKEGFDSCMQEQKNRSKASWSGSGDATIEGDFRDLLQTFGKNEFVGYDYEVYDSNILVLLDENFKIIKQVQQGQAAWVMLNKTPFYATMGGQIGDIGWLYNNDNKLAEVLKTESFNGLNLSLLKACETLKANTKITAKLDHHNRALIKRHHSATHLLHFALNQILGETVNQAGSLVSATKLRFDFTSNRGLNEQELKQIEKIVNEVIFSASKVQTNIMDLKVAKAKGAKAQFSEKYDDKVRVVSIGDSLELCGGTHIANSSEIGIFLITKETGISTGVRRIEALCSKPAYNYLSELRERQDKLAKVFKTQDLYSGALKLQEQVKTLKQELKILQNNQVAKFDFVLINDTHLIVTECNQDLAKTIDQQKKLYKNLAILLIAKQKGKLKLAAGCQTNSLNAKEWLNAVAAILGGKGGGRADFANGGGTIGEKIPEAIQLAVSFAKQRL